MSERYIISIDQSTQGTKSALFGKEGRLRSRVTLPHRQLVDQNGWVSHNPVEIYHNVLEAVKQLIDRTGVDRDKIAGSASAISVRRQWRGMPGRDSLMETPSSGNAPGQPDCANA